MSPSGGFASLLFDQAVPKNSQRHLADRNAICILHPSDCAWLYCLLSQLLCFIRKNVTQKLKLYNPPDTSNQLMIHTLDWLARTGGEFSHMLPKKLQLWADLAHLGFSLSTEYFAHF